MRQAGYLTAACLYAMDHHIDRLAEDHAHARLLAAAVADTPGLTLEPEAVETNLVWFRADPGRVGSARAVAGRLRERGVLVSALGEQVVRAVTHLGVSRAECERAAELIRRYAAG
jgi:threonine aldolase